MSKICKIDPSTAAIISEMSNVEFRAGMTELDASLDVMAQMLGIARRNIAAYRKDKIIPPYVALAVRQLLSITKMKAT